MAYFLSPALAQLRTEVNACWPHRDKSSDGWIGDTSHAARPSDHNPDRSAGGIVRALDIDEDLVAGLTAAGEAMPLVNAIIRDPRVRYVIYEGRIWTRDTGRWVPYTGVNAHRHHIHVSVRTGRGYDRDASPWGIATTVSRPGAGTGSITNPTIPGRPAPLTPRGPFMALTDTQQQQIYDALVGPNGSAQVTALMPFGQNLPTSLAQLRGALQPLITDLAPVERLGPDGKVQRLPLRQEIADTKTAIAAQAGQIAGLTAALGQIASGGVDIAKIREASRQGVLDAVASFETTQTTTTTATVKRG